MSKVDPYPPLIADGGAGGVAIGTAPCPRNSQFPRPQMQEIGSNREFISEVARRTAVEEDSLDLSPCDSPEDAGDGIPWFELRLPWEKEPRFWRHPILSNRWRRMHYRILSLERALGIHSRWHEDVLPWCPRHGDMVC